MICYTKLFLLSMVNLELLHKSGVTVDENGIVYELKVQFLHSMNDGKIWLVQAEHSVSYVHLQKKMLYLWTKFRMDLKWRMWILIL